MRYFVYVHTSPNGKRYVGATTKNPKYRWDNGNGYNKQPCFSVDIQKYGWDSFSHIVYEVSSRGEMYWLEKYLIGYYNTTNSTYGYNHSTGGKGGYSGCSQSEDTRRKLSESNKGRHHTDVARKKMSEARTGKGCIPVCQYTMDGVLIREWSGVNEVERVLGLFRSNIVACCKDRIKSSYGFRWRYKG